MEAIESRAMFILRHIECQPNLKLTATAAQR